MHYKIEKGPHFTGKDGTKWLVLKKRKIVGKANLQNIVTQLPGVKGAVEEAKTILGYWKLVLSNEIIQNITDCTKKSGQQIRRETLRFYRF